MVCRKRGRGRPTHADLVWEPPRNPLLARGINPWLSAHGNLKDSPRELTMKLSGKDITNGPFSRRAGLLKPSIIIGRSLANQWGLGLLRTEAPSLVA